jgi:hypothetical protein
MRLLPNWREIVTKAWSFHLVLLIGVGSALEVVLPMLDIPFLSPTQFAVLVGATSCIANTARLIYQRNIARGDFNKPPPR